MKTICNFWFESRANPIRSILIFWIPLTRWQLRSGSNLHSLSSKRNDLFLLFFLNSCWTLTSSSSSYGFCIWKIIAHSRSSSWIQYSFLLDSSSVWDSWWCWMFSDCVLLLCRNTRLKTFILSCVDVVFSETQALMFWSSRINLLGFNFWFEIQREFAHLN